MLVGLIRKDDGLDFCGRRTRFEYEKKSLVEGRTDRLCVLLGAIHLSVTGSSIAVKLLSAPAVHERGKVSRNGKLDTKARHESLYVVDFYGILCDESSGCSVLFRAWLLCNAVQKSFGLN